MDVRDLVDGAAEALVVPSFTRLGYDLRSRLFHWEPVEGLPMRGRVVAVTGATSGLGQVAATSLARMGAGVLLLARNPTKAEVARARITEATGNDEVRVYTVDMSDLGAVRRVVDEISASEPALDVLVNNAGSLLTERTVSVDGFEMTFATMVLGPFGLTNGLIPLMRRSADARVITVASGGQYAQSLHLDDLQTANEPYRGPAVYARAKRAQVVLTRMWAAKLRSTSVVAHAMHPGWADTPGIEASLPGFHRLLGPLLRTPEQGVDTLVWLAASPRAAASTGELWLDRRPRPFDKLSRTKVSADQARQLWEACERLTGTSLDVG
ncbi:MAG: SDR family NAD(P)-dependent oxidoreductase [Actinobacteria bacterium]|nr:SDR family NAD(P)-dependent oxidoreductase [Actinomycetota bacterium]